MNQSISAASSALPNGHDRRNVRHKRPTAPAMGPTEPSSQSSRLNSAGRESRSEQLDSVRKITKTTTTTSYLVRPTPDLSERESTPDPAHNSHGSTTWSPQVSLLPLTSAPLAGRTSRPPLATSSPSALSPLPFRQLTLRDQEMVVIEDLLFVLMGFEGQYCHYSDSYNPSDEKCRLEGPEFDLAPGLDPSLDSLTRQVLAIASHYAAVESYIDIHSRDDFGVVNHALCAAMRKPLKDFLILVAQLENQMVVDSSFSLHVMCLHLRPTANTIRQLYSLIREILRENAALNADPDDGSDSDDFEAALASLRDGPSLSTGNRICKGGAVLRLIANRLQLLSGDPTARDLLASLLHDASKPYVAMLNEWLHRGAVQDPHEEFMIKEQKSIRREGLGQDYTDEYWGKRYTTREEHVPPQLAAVKERVLLAGKYLSIVRDDGGAVVAAPRSDLDKDMPRTIDDPRLVDTVNAAYAHANSSLLRLLLTTHSLPAVFRSLKHYYFLDRSDFFSSFLHLADTELKKSAKNINVHKLQSLLDIVLRQSGSILADDPFNESVKVEISNTTLWKWLMQIVSVKGLDADGGSINSTPNPAASTRADDSQLTGFGALTLDFEVSFPLSLVVSRVTLTRYQVLFRYLFSLRHLEMSLVGTWKDPKREKNQIWVRRAMDPRIEDWKRRVWCLRGRMLCFVQQLLYFCTAEVIEPNWRAFMVRVEAAEAAEKSGAGSENKWTVDELMQDHVDFLATCLKECMLTNSRLLSLNPRVLQTCTMFVDDYTNNLTRYLDAATTNATASATDDNPAPPSRDLDKMLDRLRRFEDHFSKGLRTLLDALNYTAATETAVFTNLCARLSMAADHINGPGTGAMAWRDA